MATIFRAQDPPLDPGRDRRWSRTVVALVLAAIAVVLPVRSYVGHLSDVHALEDRAPTLAGFAGVDVDAVDNPIPNRHGALLEMRVEARAGATAEETADAVRLALIEEGFRPSYSDETLSRMIEPRRRGWQRYDRAMVEPIDNGALVTVTVGPQSQRDALPAWLLLGTALLVVATWVVRSGRSGSRPEPGLRRWLGSTVLGLGALQAGLVIWALKRARSYISTEVSRPRPSPPTAPPSAREWGMVERRATVPEPASSDRDGNHPATPADLPGGSAGDELERLQQRLSLIGQAAQLGFWEYSFEADELWVSDELASLYGLAPQDFTWPDFVSRLHPDDVVTALERPTPSYPFGVTNEFFFRVRHADGTYRSIRSRSVTYGDGEVPVRKLGVHIDMSDDTLFRVAQLSEANERLQQFASMASHDLRSPLRGIRTSLDFIVEDHGATLPTDVIERLEDARERALRLDRLVVDMLVYASADWHDLGRSMVDLRALLSEVLATVDRRQCRISLDVRVDDELPLAGRPLAGCVRNLVDNACKYHDKANGTVEVAATVDGPWLQIVVSDDGPGIAPSRQDHLFEPFRTSDPGRSSGLGLAHVHRVVERHQGSITLETTDGAGASFTLRWPLSGATDDG